MRIPASSTTRRSVLALGTAAATTPWLGTDPASASAASSAGAGTAPGELDELGIAELRRRMSDGRLDAERLTRYYLDRVRRLDPLLHSVIEINPDALREARRLDAGRRARGPLHGMPVLLKDLVETADRMHTTAGSLALEGLRPAADATVAARLRDAGAVILGKTNLSEWAGGMSLTHHAGWSARGGQTRNPYKLDRSPNESSSGTGAAVAANLCVAGIGTETNGSIVDPSSANCLVGVKPTVGLVGRGGVIPGVPSQDSVGPMARTVRDAAIMLGVLVGPDERDPATRAGRGHQHRDYTRFLDPDGLRGARIGVPRTVYFGYDQHADEIAERAITVLSKAGATVVDPADIPTAGQLEDLPGSMVVQAYEIKRALNGYLAAAPGHHPRSLAELIGFNREHADRELRYVRQDGLEIVEKLDFTEREYREALATNHRLSRAEGIDAVLREHRLDALVMPTTGPPAKIDLIRGDAHGGGSSTPAALAGYPAISVPAGFAFGLPVGLTFMGTAWSEPTLLRLAYAYEQASGVRRAPGFRAADVGF
ncbi:amidase [Streptomyces sp. Ag82_O1-12]|uniref:amidase n=1 Tax=unclassified Streptomyces TaxID=2593676 RepID=UPI000BC69FDF|nr:MULTISPECIES: amidase [unclassified Streptomyces]SMQ17127.1 amidase [Streptomyces sp. Ag82_O1-12]SOD46156.1 amidase [Streptomyces sp. Ag82_G6-1]